MPRQPSYKLYQVVRERQSGEKKVQTPKYTQGSKEEDGKGRKMWRKKDES